MNDSGKVDKYSAPALSKGLDILEFLASEPVAQKKSDIARALDRSISEIFRMLDVLKQREYVAFDDHSERYSLTTKLFEISHNHPPIKRLSAAATEIMQRLVRQTNQSTHLLIRHDTHVLVVAQVDSPGTNVLSVRLGARIPLFETASGAVLTAHAKDEERETLEDYLKAATPRQLDIYRKNCKQVLRSDYCERASLAIEGVLNLSVPVRDHAGEVVAALTIPYIKRLNDPQASSRTKVRKALIDAGSSISRLLGGGIARG